MAASNDSEMIQIRKMTFVSKVFLVLSVLSVLVATGSVFMIANYKPWAYGMMGATIVFFLLWILTAFPHVKSFVGRRSTKFGVNSLVVVVIVLGLLIGTNFLARQNEIEVDLTQDKLHSFSQQTVKVLKGIKQDVKVTTFLSPEMREVINDALQRYKIYCDKLSVRHVNIYSEPEVVRAFNVNRQNVIVFESMTRQKRIENLNPARLEEQLTNALIQVSKEGTKNVCFLQGHGELDLDSSDRKGLSYYRDTLKGNRYVGKKVSLLEVEKVPSDCAALLIVGPEKALFEAEERALTEFIDHGGKVGVFLDPYIDGSWVHFVKKWGVIAKDMVVVEYNPIAQAFGGSPVVPTIVDFDNTVPFMKGFKGRIALNLARPVISDDKLPEGLEVKAVARTTESSWGEVTDLRRVKTIKFDRGKDLAGPVPVGVHVTGKTAKGKDLDLVVFGDSDLLTNGFARYVNNSDMGSNIVAYFVKDEDLISIRPKERKAEPLNLTSQNMRVMFGLTIILFPFLFFFVAGTVYLRRRSR